MSLAGISCTWDGFCGTVVIYSTFSKYLQGYHVPGIALLAWTLGSSKTLLEAETSVQAAEWLQLKGGSPQSSHSAPGVGGATECQGQSPGDGEPAGCPLREQGRGLQESSLERGADPGGGPGYVGEYPSARASTRFRCGKVQERPLTTGTSE